jgi:DNA-binding MarR family transcriptional regulator
MTLRVGYELKRAQYQLRQATDEAARRQGITTPQYAALDVLERSPGLWGAALARACFVTPQAMNELLARLERAGLVTRAGDPSHGRRLRYTLTATGRRRLHALTADMDAVQERMVAGLTPEQVETLSAWLRACAEALEGSGADVS